MRTKILLLALPLALAACAAEPPPQTAVIETPPPAPPPPAPVAMMPATTPAESPLVGQCESIFAQSLGGQSASYSAPSLTAVGNMTTVRFAASTAANPDGPPLNYTCTFDGMSLTSSGPS